jgi:hypothetical protein
MRFAHADEQRLSDWMAQHARVSWVMLPRPWEIERVLIARGKLPLNVDKSNPHPFVSCLRTIRNDARAHALSRPLVRTR